MEKKISKSSVLTGFLLVLSSVLFQFRHLLGNLQDGVYIVLIVAISLALYHKETRQLALITIIVWGLAILTLPPILDFLFVKQH
jgi:hypothetical protein